MPKPKKKMFKGKKPEHFLRDLEYEDNIRIHRYRGVGEVPELHGWKKEEISNEILQVWSAIFQISPEFRAKLRMYVHKGNKVAPDVDLVLWAMPKKEDEKDNG